MPFLSVSIIIAGLSFSFAVKECCCAQRLAVGLNIPRKIKRAGVIAQQRDISRRQCHTARAQVALIGAFSATRRPSCQPSQRALQRTLKRLALKVIFAAPDNRTIFRCRFFMMGLMPTQSMLAALAMPTPRPSKVVDDAQCLSNDMVLAMSSIFHSPIGARRRRRPSPA